jgi:hypothetical protein
VGDSSRILRRGLRGPRILSGGLRPRRVLCVGVGTTRVRSRVSEGAIWRRGTGLLRRDRVRTSCATGVVGPRRCHARMRHAWRRTRWGTLVGGSRARAGRPGESVRAWLWLARAELHRLEWPIRPLPEVGTRLAGPVLAWLGMRLGVLLATGELTRGILLLVRAARMGDARWGSLGEWPGIVRCAGLLSGPLRPSHRHSGAAPVWRWWSIWVAALRKMLLRLRTMRTRLSLLLTMGPRRGIRSGAGRLCLMLPAGLGPGGAWPGRR